MAAFTYTDRQTGELAETDDPLVFWMALRDDAQAAINERAAAHMEAGTTRLIVAGLKSDRAYAESQAALSDEVRKGKNAEERAALLDDAVRQDPAYMTLVEEIAKREAEVIGCDAAADAAYSRLRVRLRDLEVLAAIYGPHDEPRGQ